MFYKKIIVVDFEVTSFICVFLINQVLLYYPINTII
jgi:hypothetical protein